MTVKNKHKHHITKSKKLTLRYRLSHKRKSHKQKSHKRKSHKRKSHKRKQYHMHGGNYETDVTTRTLEGIAIKPLNKIVVALPGYGTMSGSAYVRLMEDIDRNGKDIYD